MSGIYIPNRPMPEHCGECFSYHNLFGRDICWCGNGRRIELYPDKRPDWCPIVPIPDHGRLIDADALKEHFPHDEDWDYPVNTNSFVNDLIDGAPTIIPADKEDNR